MKKLFLSYFLISIVSLSLAGGGEPYPEDHFYYSMFNQELINNQDYIGFLYYTGYNDYYVIENEGYQRDQNANNDLWLTSFPSLSEYKLSHLKSGLPIQYLKEHLICDLTPIDSTIGQYFIFAQEIEKSFTPVYGDPWKYRTYLNKNSVTNPIELIQKGLKLYHSEKNKFLKQRYGYQIVKSLRYNKQYKEAIYFFQSEHLDLNDHNEIYYYTLDQIGGCYYNLKDYDKAITLFTQVSTHSKDRRASAILSYKFCLNHTDPKNVFKDKNEILNYHLLNSMSDFNDGISILKSMISIDKNDDRIEVIFARNMSFLDREIWPKNNSFSNRENLSEHIIQLKKGLLSFAKSMRNAKNKSYWNFAYYYLLGVNKHYKQAVEGFKSITDPTFIEESQDFIMLFTAMQWKSSSEINQNFFKKGLRIHCENWDYNPKQHYIKNIIFDLLYQDNKYAEAYLINHKLGQYNKRFEHQLIDSLISFINKPNKSHLEQLLSKNYDKNAIHNLLLTKGKQYILAGEFKNAEVTFNKIKQDSNSINNSIFSNTLKTCCCSCPESEMMTDSVYLADIFSFIPSKMNYLELSQSLIRLDQLGQNDTIWQGQLAHYLLGNFYNNITSTGYHYGLLWGQSACCYNSYYDYNDNCSYYSDENASYYPWRVDKYSEADTAIMYYTKVIEHSKNTELKARTTFLLAQCELNIHGDNWLWNNEGEDYKQILESHYYYTYSNLFKTLNSTYKNSKFHSKILKECSHFNKYCH